jgi:uncharacterized protein YajQ (UPF0234 family)
MKNHYKVSNITSTITTKQSDEMIKIIKDEDSFCDNIKATIMVKITKTSLEEAWLDEKSLQGF